MNGHRNAKGRSDDRGSATIWVVVGIAVLFLVAAVIMALGAAAQTHHRAAAAADLAALAAAGYAPDGELAACARARWIAGRMRVHVTRCSLVGWDALVEVSADPPGRLIGFGPVTAHSRAGPARP